MIVQRFNAVLIMDSFCSTDEDPDLQGGPKNGATYSNLNQTVLTIFFTGRFLGKFAVKWILKIPPHLA